MENYRIDDMHICLHGINCTADGVSHEENVTFYHNPALLSKLSDWEDFIVGFYLLTVGKFIFPTC